MEPTDHGRLLSMNNAAAPAVNALDADAFEALVAMSIWTRALVDVDELTGFLLGLHGPGLAYGSENYAWFSSAYESFLYVDRVVVAPHARGSGLGGRLYDAFATFGSAEGFDVLCAEVNLHPPNPGSLRFHERHGFAAVGEQDTKGGSVRVRMLARGLATDPPASAYRSPRP